MHHTTLKHLTEIRGRLLNIIIVMATVFIALLFKAHFWYDLIASRILVDLPVEIIATHVTTPLTTPIKLAFILSLMLLAPFILWHIWSFVAPALYSHEKTLGRGVILSSTCLFYLGCFFSYFVLCPLTIKFCLNFAPASTKLMPEISSYLDFVLQLMFSGGLAFQVPVITFLIVKLGILDIQQLQKMRRYVILIAFTLGMLLTPPDVVSQIILAVPMWGLFEVGLLITKLTTYEEKLPKPQQS